MIVPPTHELSEKYHKLLMRMIDALMSLNDKELLASKGLSSTVRSVGDAIWRAEILALKQRQDDVMDDLIDPMDDTEEEMV